MAVAKVPDTEWQPFYRNEKNVKIKTCTEWTEAFIIGSRCERRLVVDNDHGLEPECDDEEFSISPLHEDKVNESNPIFD